MEQSQLLRVRHLRKSITLHILHGRVVSPLEDVSFDVEEGQFLGIVGPSGAGKSSLLKCIYRTYVSDGGEINFRTAAGDVVDLVMADDREVLNLRQGEIGYVSQFLKASPRLPAIDVAALPMRRSGVPAEEARERAKAALNRLGIGADLETSYPSLFSGGEQQRVNVARALANPPRLLLLDEPSSALDADNRARVLEFLLETRRKGTTMIGVFHDIEMLSKLADRVIVLEDGHVRTDGTIDEVDLPKYIEAAVPEPA